MVSGLTSPTPRQRSPSAVVYKGADWLRENVEFAPNAVVILSHLSYASGNASSGMAIPTREVAVERVDNFANGFLASGARVVWHLGWQPGADVINALFGEDATMDAVFMTRYRDPVSPMNGWVGADTWLLRLRAHAGDRGSTSTPTRLTGICGHLRRPRLHDHRVAQRGLPPPDTEPPVISEVSVVQAAVTLSADDTSLPIFTPNGDDLSDTLKVTHVLSENAFLSVRVVKDDVVVREMSIWSMRGRGSTTWDGRRDDGEYIGEGRFRILITPTDRAGNVGQPATAKALALTALKSPSFKPGLLLPLRWGCPGSHEHVGGAPPAARQRELGHQGRFRRHRAQAAVTPPPGSRARCASTGTVGTTPASSCRRAPTRAASGSRGRPAATGTRCRYASWPSTSRLRRGGRGSARRFASGSPPPSP